MWHIIYSWFVLVTHMKQIRQIGSKPWSGHGRKFEQLAWPWSLTCWTENGTQHILSWIVFVPHMNIIHEIDNEPQSGHGMWDGQTDVCSKLILAFTKQVTHAYPLCIFSKLVSSFSLFSCLLSALHNNPTWKLHYHHHCHLTEHTWLRGLCQYLVCGQHQQLLPPGPPFTNMV